MRKLAALVVALAVAVVVVPMLPAGARVTLAEVEEARREMRRVSEMVRGEVARYEAAVAREALLQDRLQRMILELESRERNLVAARDVALQRAAEMYMSAGAPAASLVAVDDVSAFPARLVYLESVTLTDRDAVNTLEMTRRDYEQQRDLVDAALGEQTELVAEMESLVETIYAELEEANARYQDVKARWDAQEAERIRREEEERRRREFLATSTTTVPGAPNPPAPSPPTTTPPTTVPPQPAGTRVCPVDGAHSFTDTWGAPRSGGRTHTGQDLLAPHGTPVVAIEAGRVYQRNWHWAGGNQLYILGESGSLWFYAHLAAPAIVGPGARVEAGQRVGAVGSTGNASTNHLHFGWYPGGSIFGPLANPYSILRAVCG